MQGQHAIHMENSTSLIRPDSHGAGTSQDQISNTNPQRSLAFEAATKMFLYIASL